MSEEKITQSLVNEYNSKNFENYFQVKRHEMLQYIPTNATKILDVGCADGAFAQLLKLERHAEVWGVEPNSKAAEMAERKLDKVINDVFSVNLAFSKESFDCIIFNDVLEHMVDPYSALIYAKTLLKAQGTVVASIPNVRYFDNIWNLLVHQNWEYGSWGILDKTHLRFFTKRSIISTFESLGFKVQIIEGINPLNKVHPHQTKKFSTLNFLTGGRIEDMRYLQFAVLAVPIKHN